MRKLLTFFTLILLFLSVVCFAQITPKKTDEGRGYMEYLPIGYDTAKLYPVIIFLHGSGERSTGSATDLAKLKNAGVLKSYRINKDFIILCPQTQGWSWRSTRTVDGVKTVINDANEFTAWALRNYPIDNKKVYITGLSMGGEGTWFALADAPQLYAAGAPVCGRASNAEGQKVARGGVKIWAFHGSADTSIRLSSHWNAISGYWSVNYSGLLLTVYPGVGHNCWDRAYSDPQLYVWLLKQARI